MVGTGVDGVSRGQRAAGRVVPSVARLVREHRGRFDLADLTVHPDDEMMAFDVKHASTPAIAEMNYFRNGLVISDTLRSVVDQWCPGGPSRILDFACGYGRALRFTIQDFGADRVWGSDILPGAVRHIGDQLGAHAVQSAGQPEDLSPQLDGPFDVIFVSSLFTHLPERTFTRWLQALYERLDPSGLLAFSVHGETLLPDELELPPEGLLFGETTEIEALDTKDYGVAIVSEDFVAGAIKTATGHDTYRRLPVTLAFGQDLYLVPRSGAEDAERLGGLVVRHGAQGHVDECRVEQPGRLRLLGWATTQDGDVRARDVEIRIDDQLVARAPVGTERPDVAARWIGAAPGADCLHSGWSTTVELASDPDPHSTVTFTARLSDGSLGVFWSSELGELIGEPEGSGSQSLSVAQRVRATWHAEGATGVARAVTRRLTGLLPKSS